MRLLMRGRQTAKRTFEAIYRLARRPMPLYQKHRVFAPRHSFCFLHDCHAATTTLMTRAKRHILFPGEHARARHIFHFLFKSRRRTASPPMLFTADTLAALLSGRLLTRISLRRRESRLLSRLRRTSTTPPLRTILTHEMADYDIYSSAL